MGAHQPRVGIQSTAPGLAITHPDDVENNIAVSQHHDGFENTDGGYGTLTINVEAATVTLQHSTRFVDSITTETEFLESDGRRACVRGSEEAGTLLAHYLRLRHGGHLVVHSRIAVFLCR